MLFYQKMPKKSRKNRQQRFYSCCRFFIIFYCSLIARFLSAAATGKPANSEFRPVVDYRPR